MRSLVPYAMFASWLICSGAAAAIELAALLPADSARAATLGSVEVPGFGRVSLLGSRGGARVLLHAVDPDGAVIGRAEGVFGTRDTPIFVRAGAGLEEISIVWRRGTEGVP